jgi:hypothetical protein
VDQPCGCRHPEPVSRSLQVVLSTFGWWVLVILPAALTLLGVFGDLGTDTGIGGAVVGVWVACYLAQLAMVSVMQHALGHSRVSWFFVASLLPWAVDWSAPVGWGWGLLWIGIAGAVAVAIILLSLRTVDLDTRGTVVTATVKKILRNYMNVVINGVYIYRHLLLDIPGADGAPAREDKLWMLCEIGTSPSVGEHIRLRVDPRNPRRYEVDPSQFDRD